MASSVIGALRVNLGLDSAQFQKGLKNAQSGLQRAGKQMQRVGLAATAVGAGVALAVRGQLNAADDLSKAAQRIGIPIEALSQLQFAAELSGASLEELETGIGRLSRNMIDSEAKFTALGIAVRDATGNIRPTQDVLFDLSDVLASMPDGAEKTAIAMDLMGRGGAALIPTLNGGADALRAMMAEADALGLTISAETGKAAEEFNDNLSRLSKQITGIVRIMAAQLAPILQQISEFVVAASEKFRSLSPEMQKFIGVFGGLSVVIGPIVLALGTLVVIMGALSAPVLAVVAAVTALTAAAIAFGPEIIAAKDAIVQFGRDGVQFVKDKFEELIAFFRELPQRMITLGEELIEGLKLGILRKWESVKSSVLGVGESITTGFKDIFGIQSPSKVFAEIGQNLMAGLGLGVQEGKGAVTGELQTAADEITGLMGGLGQSFEAAGGGFGDMVADLVTGARKASDVLSELGTSLLKSGISGLFNSFGGGDLFGGLFAGLFDRGGRIGAGQFGIVGERGPEIVTGPANVTSRVDTARMMNGNTQIEFKVVNNRSGNEVTQRRERGPDGRTVLIAEINEAATTGQLDRGFGSRFGAQPQKARR